MKVVSPTDDALRIGEGPHPPGAGRNRGIERQRQAASARALIGQHRAAEFDAVGPLDHQRQRTVGDRIALAVAQQRGEIDRLAGAIDATLGIDEGIGAGRHLAPGDAAVGQVEGVGFQAEERIVGLVAGDGQQRRRQAALAARQSGLEQHMAGIVGLAGGQDFVVARHQPHLGLADRIGRSQRIDEHVDAVIARKRRQTEIGDDEPLGRQRAGIRRRRRTPAPSPRRSSHRRRAAGRRSPDPPGRRW